MKYIILVLWTFSLFLLMFSSFPFRVECRPTRSTGPHPPRPQSAALIQIPGSTNAYFNSHHQLLQHSSLTSSLTSSAIPCPVLEGPSAARFNPWPDLYIPDVTAKAWESPIVLEGTARSRSEVRPDGTFGVTFDLHRVVKGDAPLLRRRRQFRLQFLDNPNPSPDSSHPNQNQRDRDKDSVGGRNKNPNKNNKVNNSTLISSSTKSSSRSSGSSNIINNNNNRNNNLNNVYNSHSNPPNRGGSSSSSTSSLTTRQLHPPPQSSQSHQLQLYQQQQQLNRQQLILQQATRQLMAQQQSQTQVFRQSQSLRPTFPPNRGSGVRNSSLPQGGWGSSGSSSVSSTFQSRPGSNVNARNLGGSGSGRRSGRSMSDPGPSGTTGNKCVPPRATVKTGRKYYVFAAKVENHFIAVFSPELQNKRNTKAVEGILCKGCGQAPSVVSPQKDVQLNVKERIRLRCRLRAGNPIPLLTWYKDGRPVNLTDTRFRLRTKRRQSILVIRKAREIDVGIYRCEAKNVFGSAYASVRVSLAPPGSAPQSTTPLSRPKSTLPKPNLNSGPLSKRPSSSKTVETTATTLWPLEARECPYDSYCLNGGTCSYFETIGEFVCQCTEGFKGQRCDTKDISSSSNSGGDYESRRLLNLWD